MAELELMQGGAAVPARAQEGRTLPASPEMMDEIRAMRGDLARVMSVLVAQQTQIARLTQALSTVRVSRTQEKAIGEAIRRRAGELCALHGLPPAAKRRVGSAIRATLREAAGARAIGDIQAAQFERVIALVNTWNMAGALRRIRRETEDDHG